MTRPESPTDSMRRKANNDPASISMGVTRKSMFRFAAACGFFMFMLLAACDAPGEGHRFEQVRKEAERVMVALARYRAEEGCCPERLDALSPLFLPEGYFESDRAGRATTCFELTNAESSGYNLRFGYNGPGINHCEYVRGTTPTRWECYGYY